MYLPAEKEEPLGRLEDALRKVIAAEPVEKKLKEAIKDGLLKGGKDAEVLEAGIALGIITGDEANSLFLSWEARQEVIRVDDFPSFER
jgi:acyl-CoA dehydrogenase